MSALSLVLLLLGASVLAVVICRRINLPPVLGYLFVGSVIGPHALNLMNDMYRAEYLAEFGVVFLMFSIGLEFSLPKLYAMKRIVFGLGLLQVVLSMVLIAGLVMLFGVSWQVSIALGGVFAMSSTAVLTKLLAERMQLDSPHGRDIMGVLLFQDLAVVPLLVIIPSLTQPPEKLAMLLGVALIKAIVVLAIILVFGQRLMRKWFHFVARAKSSEVFVLNVLLITLSLATITELAGLSLALGAFVAGMLISETEYKMQVEEDIKPFRDVLMGLFFVTIGVKLDMHILVGLWWQVLLALVALLVVKSLVVGLLSWRLGASPGNAIRSALWLCAGGEFGFVLLGEIVHLPREIQQIALTVLVLSMLIAPFIVQYSERLVMRFVASEWLVRSMQLTRIAAQSMGSEKHAILCGFGRNGQYLARFLAQEDINYVALDLDPDRVREAAAGGENVVYGDVGRKEALMAAGLMRASVVIVTVSDTPLAEKVLHHVQALRPEVPVVVRTADERDMERLTRAGAAEVVPETLEASLMLASHALVLVGIPINRVLKRVRQTRSKRYSLLRGYYRGMSDRDHDEEDEHQPRLHSVLLASGSSAIGRTLDALNLEALGCEVSAIRRRGIRALEPAPETRLEEGDVVVLLGVPEAVTAAEERLLQK
ncbi:monovalent cation:proton antiporter family protein [Ferribacterium limneticum]|uniref:monovalent cation:proton antiporter family protein n=1 Tax=Ferribacterium limneticum TaxID=76259 RepID=UPI001CFA487B|nr:monovalent cation:proton antiporter family protein [Ferribacterium limneticum]UCV29228.1 monovalent cation:proton antiporter-2 (CPA2) family protein [Ferribacterium limneticum]UCV33147.1 monovalent cation:proton antiporter-2 (CPA2) family protein [Ferribacterium limneticum]